MKKFLLALALFGLIASISSVRHARSSRSFFQSGASQGDQVVLDFIRGFLVSLRLNRYISEIQPCLVFEEAHQLLTSAAEHLKHDSLLSLLLGVTEVGRAAQVIPDAFAACNVELPHDIDLQGALLLFQDPHAFDYLPGKSLWVDGFEVYPHIFLAQNSVQKGGRNAWYLFGKFVAKGLVHVALGPDDTLDPSIVEYLNEKGGFEASVPDTFEGMTLREVSSIASTLIEEDNFGHQPDPIDEAIFAQQTIPANYDWRTAFPSCVRPVRDQGYCGSCWAFATASTFMDRICTNMTLNASRTYTSIANVELSPQFQVSCDTGHFGCGGGYLSKSWKWFEFNGTHAESCNPYLSYNGTSPTPYTCASGCNPAFKYYARINSTLKYATVSSIRTALFRSGPLSCSMNVYEDFYVYRSGIYRYTTGALLGGHAVKIVGWGNDTATNTAFWIVQNSWGSTWGENGYFRIATGQVGIDTNCWTGLAAPERNGR